MAQPVMSHDVRSPASQVRIVPDLDALSHAAAEEFVTLAHQQAQGNQRFSVALAGASTPRRLYRLLANEPYRSRMPWECVHVFWGDERCVPPDHPESNFHMAHDALLAHVPVPAANVHRVPVEERDPASVAMTYERTLRTCFQLEEGTLPEFDLVLLGLGEDGHTGSLFPRSAALQETQRLVAVTTGGKPNLPRVTLTIPVLNHARRLLWLIVGAEKATAVQAVLEGGNRSDDLPATLVEPQGPSVWLLDQAAASLLRSRPTHGTS